ncbi:MAG TPA: DUF488 domain-containing protein [Bryobacteraceae bacterium]|nr:DUF488 domain-containing protein [Bryobacteraceae bacterium]
MIKVKRAYEEPGDGDGRRYLVDRLWPRGRTKDSLKLDGWLKDVAPSQSLRRWFNHDTKKWDEFRQKYFDELNAKPEGLELLIETARKGHITLIYGAHDTEHNNAVALAEYLKKKTARQTVQKKKS